MKKSIAGKKVRLFNIGLRLISLGTKLLLTLYMGRLFSLAEMGVYGPFPEPCSHLWRRWVSASIS